MRRAASLAALAAVVIACSGSSPGRSYETIAEAVAAAPTGGTVRIPAGNYVESITIDRPMTLVAEPGGVHLTGRIVVDASGVTVEGFTIQADGTAASGVHLETRSSAPTIADLSSRRERRDRRGIHDSG